MIITRVLTTTQVSIDDPADPRLAMRLKRGIYFGGAIPVEVYPRVDAINARYGTLTYDGARVETVREMLAFRGSPAQTKWPNPGNILFEDVGGALDVSLQPVVPSYVYDSYRDAVIPLVLGVEAAVIGTAHIIYDAPYRLYQYSPFVGEENGVVVTRYSNIVGRLGKTIAVLEIDANSVESSEYEVIYEVVSDVVVDSDGAWELPPNFPTSNTYPGIGVTGPSTSSYLVDTRKHEFGYINRDGYIQTERAFVRYEQPYTGSATYKPAWRFTKNTSPPSGFESAFAGIPWGSIESSVSSRYSGIVV